MRKIINQLLEGKFEYDRGFLEFSCPKLELTLEKDSVYEDSFTIYSSPHRMTEGYVYASDTHMQCLTPRFVGNGEVIMYRVDTTGLEEGEVLEGRFYVVSNQGEYVLPFIITVAYTVMESSLGEIRNLFHFANLAKTNWWEAVRLFYSPKFKKIFTGSDRQYLGIYEGLSKYNGNEQNIEEFLLQIKKKQKIEYIIEETELLLENPEGVMEYELPISRNGWGYTCLYVETEGDFLYVSREKLTEEDFLGNICRLSVQVDSAHLHRGNNYGCIRLWNAYTDLNIPVTVRYTGQSVSTGESQKKAITLQIMKYYQDFRVKKMNLSAWLEATGTQVESLLALDDNNITARLFQAQLLITREHFNEADWILEHVKKLLDEAEAVPDVYRAYYLYLTTLLSREENYIDEIASQVEEMFLYHPDEWRIAWLLLYLKPEYSYSAAKKWMFLEEQFKRGCHSPIIYIEAFQLIAVNPTLLMKLEEFEVQVLYYIVRKGILTRPIADQIHCLIPKMKEYSGLYYRMLTACYEIVQDREILTAICTLLMKGGKIGKEYFSWYKKGVEQEIRLTRLYESYMMSLDTEREEILPKMVLRYFSYHSELDYEKNAYLYNYIYQHREENRELYFTYEEKIERFMEEQIGRQHINRNLANLYEKLLTPQVLHGELAEAMAPLLFTHIVCTERKDMKRVVVYQPRAGYEQIYQVNDGTALVPVYGSDSIIFFEDGNYNRFSESVPYTMKKLMQTEPLFDQIAPMVHHQLGVDIYVSERSSRSGITPENEEHFRNLLASPAISLEYKREVGSKLLHYYYDHDRMESLDEYLQTLPVEVLESRERKEALHFMILRGLYEQAYEWIQGYGCKGIEPKMLVRLSSRLLEETEFTEDALVTEMAIQAFRQGKYDENTLRYLVKYYEGTTKELRDIWIAATAASADTCELCEKMLIQMLFTGAYVGEKLDIYAAYAASGGSMEIEEAFLTRCAYDYFIRDKMMGAVAFKELLRLAEAGRVLHLVCKLSCLKFYALNRDELETDRIGILRFFLREAMGDRIHFEYYKELYDIMPEAGQLIDKTMIEYHAKPGSRAVIHYMIGREEEDGNYIVEEMKEVFAGVYIKEVVLFFGETLQYYIMEKGEEEQLTESATIQKNDSGVIMPESKYNMINDIVMSKAMQDFKTVDEMLKEYRYRDYMTNQIFPLQ